MALEGGGCEVVGIASSAREAYSMAKARRPDVVLMDIKLKGREHGIESARSIIANYDIPVIFITGNTDEETKKRALQVNPAGYLEKPIDCEKLHQALCEEQTLEV
jgi:DNA-binding NarL/FixJ family response regulator